MRPGSAFRGGRRGATLAVALALAGCGGSAAERDRVVGRVATIYASVPLRGDSAPAGRDVEAGERMALAEARGRAGGLPVRYVALDETDPKTARWTPARVEDNARTALRDPSAIAYLGEVDPAASAVSVVILNVRGLLAVSPSDTFAGLTRPEGGGAGEPERFYPRGGRTFARVIADDVDQAAALVDWMRRDGVRRLAILDDDALYGRSLAEQVRRDAEDAGLEVVDTRPVVLGAVSFEGVTGRLGPEDPDAVLVSAADGHDAGRLVRALHDELGRVPIYVPGGVNTPAFARAVGPAAAQVRMTDPAVPLGASAPAREFTARFRRRYGRAPGPYAALGYEAMRVALDAIVRAGPRARDRRAVAHAAHGVRRRDSPLGPYTIRPSGASTRSAVGRFLLRNGRPRALSVVENPAR